MPAQELFLRVCCSPAFRATRYYRTVYRPSLKLYAAGIILRFIVRNLIDC